MTDEQRIKDDLYWEAWRKFLWIWTIVGIFSLVFSWMFWVCVNFLHQSFLMFSEHLRGW